MDAAAKWTDAQLKALEKRINAEYTKAYKEIKKEMLELATKLTDPNLSPHKRMLLATQNKRLQTLIDQMTDTLKAANATTARFVTQSAQNIFKHNYNTEAARLGFDLLDDTAVRNILTGEVNPFTKLSIAADKEKAPIMRKLESELTTAILKGESIPDIARRLKSVSEGYLSNTIRIARTETTRVQNSARQSVGEYGKAQGFTIFKEWIATNDARTREEHRAANGQQVPIDEPFKVGGEELMYAGDVSLGASPWNTINCFDGNVNVFNSQNAIKSYKHSYTGELLHVKTASGIEFTVTPNHPILTDKGFIAVGTLNIGDNIIIGGVRKNNLVRFAPNKNEIPTEFCAFHDFFKVMGEFKRVRSANGNFHGDVSDSDVEVITLKSFLPNRVISFFGKKIKNFLFAFARFVKKFFRGKCFSDVFHIGSGDCSACNVGGKSDVLLFSKRSLRHSIKHCFGTVTGGNIVFTQDTINNIATNIVYNRKLFDRLPRFIGFDKIVGIDRSITTHIVYNLETKNNLYLANSIAQRTKKVNHIGAIFHNCRCTMINIIKKKEK